MAVTIDDVARTAGVSTATVSRALRGLPHVHERTRAVVHRTASDLGYVPSKSAATLATGRTRTVGVLTPHVAKWWFAQAIEALEDELRASSYDLLLLAVPRAAAGRRPAFDPEQLRQRVDAVAVLSVPLTGGELDGLRRLHLPLAFLGASVSGAMSVRVDDVGVGRTATEHLLALGHIRIGHIGGDPEEAWNVHAFVDRRAGWMSALRAAGLSPDHDLDVSGALTVAGGRAAMSGLLALEQPPTAVFVASDEMAFGALTAVRDAGLRTPQDVSVVGVDDHELAELFGLTTVRQSVEEQGRAAARMLLSTLAGTPAHSNEHLLLPTTLLQRVTTGPGARAVLPDR